MKKLLELVAVIIFSTGLVIGQDPCVKCKCDEYPVPAGCEKCCGVISGKVKFSKPPTVTVVNDQESLDLQITDKTVVRGRHEEGDIVTVVYRKSTKVAGLIIGQ